eukprot:TRINITY_DN8537_c0_g1_i2.p1 TRINITY_DN8537_c0_g1~~TRINITY_DN8537_c0_g1_i2.p1  ORF type:complete len:165 (+),score=30.35 TRINITY_DN8537_c0_g1_i2:90-584(+)
MMSRAANKFSKNREKAREKAENKKQKREEVPNDVTFARGQHCEVHKHGAKGTAAVIVRTEELKVAMLKFMEVRDPGDKAIWKVGAHQATVQDYVGMKNRRGIFISWGEEVEKVAPCSAETVAHLVDVVAGQVKTSLEKSLQPPPADQVPFPLFERARRSPWNLV